MPISNNKKATAAMKVLLSAKHEWNLSDDELYQLLGQPDPTIYPQYLKGQFTTVSDDLLVRLAYLTTIYAQLKSLYSPENQILWLKNISETKSIWKGHSPLVMMCSSLEGIMNVLQHVNGFKGA